MNNTPETDAAEFPCMTWPSQEHPMVVKADYARKLKRERDEARGQRDRLAKALRECREDSIELLGERDWWQHEPRGDYQQRYQETRHNVKRADAALKSLTPNAELIHGGAGQSNKPETPTPLDGASC